MPHSPTRHASSLARVAGAGDAPLGVASPILPWELAEEGLHARIVFAGVAGAIPARAPSASGPTRPPVRRRCTGCSEGPPRSRSPPAHPSAGAFGSSGSAARSSSSRSRCCSSSSCGPVSRTLVPRASCASGSRWSDPRGRLAVVALGGELDALHRPDGLPLERRPRISRRRVHARVRGARRGHGPGEGRVSGAGTARRVHSLRVRSEASVRPIRNRESAQLRSRAKP